MKKLNESETELLKFDKRNNSPIYIQRFVFKAACIQFRYGNSKRRPDFFKGMYQLNVENDGWFRIWSKDPVSTGKGYGLAIRDIRTTTRAMELIDGYNVFQVKVQFLPSSEDQDDPALYETGLAWLYVHENFTIDEVLDYIKRHKDSWVP